MKLIKGLTPLGLVLASTAMMAQETTGTLTGTVRDKSGHGIAGASVRLSSPKMLLERVILTNDKGDYRIPLLPTGVYTINFSAKGYLTNRGTFQLVAGQTQRQDGVLPVESVTGAVVEVTASVAQVDKTETVTQTNLDSESLTHMGLLTGAGNDFLFGLVNSAPGVSGTGDTASIRGGVGSGANVTLNGGSVKSMVKNLFEMTITIPDMVESVALIQSPLNAKYGYTDGGTMAFTTSRGSNEFSGSIRFLNMDRGFWSTTGNWDDDSRSKVYPNRKGEYLNNMRLKDANDNLAGQWNITVKGPIWKDHITFAYAGILTGNQAYQRMRVKSYSDKANPTDTQSTYFKDLADGTVVRSAQLSPYDGKLIPQQKVDRWNQYNLYYQINASHQLEFSYTNQFHSDNIENGAWSSFGWPGIPDGTFDQDRTIRNYGYKGLIGEHGVLELRVASKKEAYVHAGSASAAVQTYIGRNNVRNSQGVRLPASNPIDLWNEYTPGLTEYGRSYGDHDTLSTLTDSLNYQHILDASGTHIIDVGVSDLGSKYENQNVKDFQFQTFGHIASDRGVAAKYADMFIVIPYNATVSDVIGGGDYNHNAYGLHLSGSTLFRDAASVGPVDIMTQMNLATGPQDGVFRSNTRAFYLNDQWAINKYHSFMAGLRLEHFKFWDPTRTIHSYSQFTPRFEYKWDVNGDQARIVNISYGEFADALQSNFFSPYAQSYLPYRTKQLWTGNDPANTLSTARSPYDNPNAPYLVTKAQLMDPANYKILPGSLSSSSQAGGLSEQVDSSLRGPVSREITVGFRRTLENGSFYRVTYVHKTWRHLFDYFPAAQGVTQSFDQTYFPGVASAQVLPRILKDDPDARRTYKAVELEWNFIFTKRVTFGGNYTYSRLTANDSGTTLDNAMGLGGKGEAIDRNWRTYLDTYVPRSERQPESLRAGGSTIHAWLTADLSVGKLKEFVALRGNYLPGLPYSNYSKYLIDVPTIANYPSTDHLPSSVQKYYDGVNRFLHSDSWTMDLHYNLELPIIKSLTWVCAIDIKNVLNNMARAGYELQATSGTGDWRGSNARVELPNGPMLSRDTRAAEGRFGFRSVSFETGLRF